MEHLPGDFLIWLMDFIITYYFFICNNDYCKSLLFFTINYTFLFSYCTIPQLVLSSSYKDTFHESTVPWPNRKES